MTPFMFSEETHPPPVKKPLKYTNLFQKIGFFDPGSSVRLSVCTIVQLFIRSFVTCTFLYFFICYLFIFYLFISPFVICSFLHFSICFLFICTFVFCSFVRLFSVLCCFSFIFALFFAAAACVHAHSLTFSSAAKVTEASSAFFLFSGSFNPSLGFPTSKGTDRKHNSESLRELTAQKVSRSSLKK